MSTRTEIAWPKVARDLTDILKANGFETQYATGEGFSLFSGASHYYLDIWGVRGDCRLDAYWKAPGTTTRAMGRWQCAHRIAYVRHPDRPEASFRTRTGTCQIISRDRGLNNQCPYVHIDTIASMKRLATLDDDRLRTWMEYHVKER